MSSALRKARTLLSHGARWRLAITIAAVLTLLLDVLESMRTARRYALGLDYHIYVSAARIGLERGWSHIYDRGLQSQFQLLLHPPAWPVVGGSAGPFHSADYYFLPFYNPPPQAWLMVPFTRLPYALSYLAWAALGLAALVAAMRWAIPEGARGRATIILAAVSPWVVMVGLHVGQGVVLVAAAVLLSWGLMRRGHDVPAGVVLAAMVLKPHPAILIPFALLACGRWRVFLGWAGAVGVLAAASIATVGLAGTQEYVRQLAATHPPSDDYLTLHGLLGPGGVTAALEVGVVAATLGCSASPRMRASGFRSRRPGWGR